MTIRDGKTLLISEIFPPRIGGSGSWLWEVYRRLPVREYAVLVGHHNGDVEFDAQNDLDITRMNLTSSSWSPLSREGAAYYLRMCKAIRRAVRTHSASHLQCARVMPEGIAAYFCRRLFGLRYSCFVHGEDITLAAESRESRLLVSRVIANASGLVCNSNNTARLLIDHWGVDEDRIIVMHPGVDTKRFTPSDDMIRVRERLGWNDRKVVLTVSRLEKRKGHDRVIEAMALVREEVPDALYAIVGNGEEADSLRTLVSKLRLESCVDILEPASDEQLPEYYQACDLFVLANRTVGSSIEGFGIVLLEAQACGKPVIAGNSGGTAETLEAGVTGNIVDARFPEQVASEIVRLLKDDDLRGEMGRNAREHMCIRFDWPALATEAEAIFETLRAS